MSHAPESTTTSTQIHLRSRPTGWPTPENFETVTVTYGPLEPGQVRVRNEYVSVDPYMRGRMNDTRSYVAPYALGAQIGGGAVGRVIASTSPAVPVGAAVLHGHGWSDVVQADAGTVTVLDVPEGTSLSLYLHVLGMTGLTAYAGLTAVAQLREGDTVFISGAAGAVGSIAGQIAQLLGASRVIGSAGSDAKVSLLTSSYGYDAAFNYKDGPVAEQLAGAAPDGIDVYFDNVGGEHLEAAIGAFNDEGRGALCGAISVYNGDGASAGPANMSNLITRHLTLQGFTVGQYAHLATEYHARMSAWLTEGRVAYEETVVDGIENTVEAFVSMMRGANTGKMLVRVS